MIQLTFLLEKVDRYNTECWFPWVRSDRNIMLAIMSVNMCRTSFITTVLTKFYMTVCMLLTYGKHFAWPHHFNRREVWTHNCTIEIHIPSQESVWLYICVRNSKFASTSTIFQLDFGAVSTGWYCLSFILLDIYYTHFK